MIICKCNQLHNLHSEEVNLTQYGIKTIFLSAFIFKMYENDYKYNATYTCIMFKISLNNAKMQLIIR